MKKSIVFIITVLMANVALAQNVGIGTLLPHASAKLEITSTNSGMLIPRMSKTERNLIASPANGLLVFQNAPDSIGFYYYNSGSWVWLQNASGAGSGWSTTGNTGTDTSVNFIGTTDNMPLQFKFNNQKAGLLSQENTAFGYHALNSLNNGSLLNTAIGHSALGIFENGFGNVGLGSAGLGQLKEGNTNIGIGFGSSALHHGNNNILISNTNGAGTIDTFLVDNVVIGNHLPSTGLSLGSDKNVLIGNYAGGSYINGGSNVAVGDSASASNTTGTSNVAIGAKALASNTTKNDLVAIGDSSLYKNGIGANSTEAIDNLAVGSKALFANTKGSFNIAVGNGSLNKNITGSGNTSIGVAALFNNNGSLNTAMGNNSLYNNTTSSSNTAYGAFSLANCFTGSNNTAIGSNSLASNSTGYSNVAVGIDALRQNTTKNNLVAIGDSALYNNGIGASAGTEEALYNTAVGSKALYSNAKGYYNTALGFEALKNNSEGIGNTAVGYNTLRASIAGFNTAVGGYALQSSNGTIAFSNAALGFFTLTNLTTGQNNTALGSSALQSNLVGNNNVALGYSAGFNELGSNKLYIENTNADKNNALIYGDFAADSINLNAKVNIRDFTRLGTQTSGAPAIKMKKIVIAAGPAVDANANYPFGGGITDSKILGVDVLLRYDASTSKIPPSYKDAAGYEYNIQVQFNGITVINKVGNSANIGGKPITILITYEE